RPENRRQPRSAQRAAPPDPRQPRRRVVVKGPPQHRRKPIAARRRRRGGIGLANRIGGGGGGRRWLFWWRFTGRPARGRHGDAPLIATRRFIAANVVDFIVSRIRFVIWSQQPSLPLSRQLG